MMHFQLREVESRTPVPSSILPEGCDAHKPRKLESLGFLLCIKLMFQEMIRDSFGETGTPLPVL